ncbi:Cytochrome c oxidase subunit 5A [Tulasnella sp. 419]|nr:Cytochrome c oxidase subunit 5A [Tulasnella sp. 418]KAG8968951.1 Cytochrome c oxidase subunit 5A [Tulasnella sp. 419]
MNALRLSSSLPLRATRAAWSTRSLATASTVAPTSSGQSVIPLSNVEAQWKHLSPDERAEVHKQLEDIQKRDWKTLSIDEKKAAYYVSFGPHGPRAPIDPPGSGIKVFLGTLGLVGVSGILFLTLRAYAAPPPRTLTKEWQEASNEKALEEKQDPITGITSEGYKGTGHVTFTK